MTKRKSLSKKIRFEVLKRDSFKCQYCGKSSPDVVLEIDHIKPVSEGGTNHITNLITACFDCNRGKTNVLLGDNAVIEKQRQQLEELNERRNQLKMMMEWREELIRLELDKVNIIVDKWEGITEYTVNDNGKKNIKKWLKRFDINTLLDCLDISASQYLKLDKDGDYSHESVEKAFNIIPGIAANRQKQAEKPELKELFYIRGILRNRLSYCNNQKAIEYLQEAYESGASIESLKELALDVKNWTCFIKAIEDFLENGK